MGLDERPCNQWEHSLLYIVCDLRIPAAAAVAGEARADSGSVRAGNCCAYHGGRYARRCKDRVWCACDRCAAAARLRPASCARRCAAVGNIPYDMNEDQLRKLFSTVGPVIDIRYRRLRTRVRPLRGRA